MSDFTEFDRPPLWRRGGFFGFWAGVALLAGLVSFRWSMAGPFPPEAVREQAFARLVCYLGAAVALLGLLGSLNAAIWSIREGRLFDILLGVILDGLNVMFISWWLTV